MDITLQDDQTRIALNPPKIRTITKKILTREQITQATLCIAFVTRQKIKALNKKFLKRDYGTDVLAFDFSDGRNSKQKPKSIQGDIIISTDAAMKNARVFGTTIAKELSLYIIHGILHLLGYDDHKVEDITKMRKREQEILKYLGNRIEKIVN